MILTGEDGSTWRKPLIVATFPPQITHAPKWDWIRFSVVTGRPLRFWAMALPCSAVRTTGTGTLVLRRCVKYTNKMQRYTIFFITVNALHFSGGLSAHHQELKNCKYSIWYMSNFLLVPLEVAAADLTYTRCCVYISWAPDGGRRNRLKHVEHWQ
jgi:hypothetical protein